MMLKDFADVKMETITWISDLVRPFLREGCGFRYGKRKRQMKLVW